MLHLSESGSSDDEASKIVQPDITTIQSSNSTQEPFVAMHFDVSSSQVLNYLFERTFLQLLQKLPMAVI